MVADFYIIPESFFSDDVTEENFYSSLYSFLGDYNNLIKYKEENKIYIQKGVFETQMPNGVTLGEFAYSDGQNLNGKQRSLKQTLSNIFNKIPRSEAGINEIKGKIINNSIDHCTGIISLYEISGLANENQIIYDKDSWFSFRRHHLGLFFGNKKYFIDECIKYFPELFFHENNYQSVEKILNDFALKIIQHLSPLNDILPEMIKNNNTSNHTELLSIFSNKANLDEKATLQGSSKTKLRFKFTNIQGKIDTLVCEPHMKLSKNDSGDGNNYNRIYFHLGKKEIENSKILVAHIGKHL